MCRGINRYVEVLHLNDPDLNPTSSELLLERYVAKEREPGSTKIEPSTSIEETHTKLLKNQTNPVCNCSESVIPVEERKWNDILACQYLRGHTFEAEVSSWTWHWHVIMIKMKEKQTAVFIGNRWVQNCEKRFRRLEGNNSRTLIGFNIFTEEATKRGSSSARIPEMSCCTFAPFKDTLVGIWQRQSWWVTSLFHTNGKNSCFIVDNFMMSLQSSNQDLALEDEKAKKKDGPSSSHFSTHSGTSQTKKNPATISRSRKKDTTTASGNLGRTPSSGPI